MELAKRVLILTTVAAAMLISASAKELVLSYDAFGPQALAYKVIGYEWWQWESEGGENRAVKYPIKVVVFWNESKETVRSKYPVDKKLKHDYRYLEYDAAMKYLNTAIDNLRDLNLSSVRLEKTRDMLIEARSHCPSR